MAVGLESFRSLSQHIPDTRIRRASEEIIPEVPEESHDLPSDPVQAYYAAELLSANAVRVSHKLQQDLEIIPGRKKIIFRKSYPKK